MMTNPGMTQMGLLPVPTFRVVEVFQEREPLGTLMIPLVMNQAVMIRNN